MSKVSEHDPAAHRPGEPDPAAEPSEEPAADAPPARRDDGPVRRALIRATLTPSAGVPPTPREPPVFTMHQQARGGGGGGSGRGNFRFRPGRPDRADGYSDQVNGNKAQVNGNKAPRPGQRNERSGQHRFGSTSRPAASRRGRGRSR